MSYIPLADDPPRMTTGINLHSTPPIVEPVAIHGSYNFEDNRDEGVEKKKKEKETGTPKGGRRKQTHRRKRRKKKSSKKRKKRTRRRRRKKGRKTKRKR